jgi:hypothetical protein
MSRKNPLKVSEPKPDFQFKKEVETKSTRQEIYSVNKNIDPEKLTNMVLSKLDEPGIKGVSIVHTVYNREFDNKTEVSKWFTTENIDNILEDYEDVDEYMSDTVFGLSMYKGYNPIKTEMKVIYANT